MSLQPLSPLVTGGTVKAEIKLSGELDGRQYSPGYYKQTDASLAFRQVSSRHHHSNCHPFPPASPLLYMMLPVCLQEWDQAKARQDKALDNIEKGLGVLKGLGEAMGENLSQQDILLTEIDSKVLSTAGICKLASAVPCRA